MEIKPSSWRWVVIAATIASVALGSCTSSCHAARSSALPAQRTKPQRPHIVFILMDDVGWNDVSMHGSPQIPTPNIDDLAREGVLLDNYYVNPVCSPTRASLLSGRSVVHHGVFTPYPNGQNAEGLNLSYTLLPQHLQSLGYRTKMVGKYHLGMKSPAFLPSARGFEDYLGYYSGVMDYWLGFNNGGPLADGMNGLDMHSFNASTATPQPRYDLAGMYSSDLFASVAKQWIADHAKNDPSTPLFMYLALQGCHSGNNHYVNAPPDKIKQFNSISPNETCGQYEPSLSGNCTLRAMRKSIAGCMSSVDDAVGVVREALKDAGMADDTLVVLSTDNGGPTAGADSNNMNNFPLRGCKGGYFDGGMRAVGAITGPLAKKSYVSRALHHVSDWLPTLLTAAARGLPDEDGNVPFPHARFDASATRDGELPFLPGDGVDNWDAINAGAPSARAELLHVAQANGSVLDAHAIRVGDMKLLWHPAGTDCSTSHAGWYPPPGLTWNYTSFTVKCPQPPDTPEHKLLQQCTQDAPCLFNITADPCEMNNLAAAMPDQVHRLKARMDTYLPHVVLPWNNYRGDTDPRSAPSNHGPQVPIANQGPTFPGAPTTFNGIWGPWLTDEEASNYYPVHYEGPGYPSAQ